MTPYLIVCASICVIAVVIQFPSAFSSGLTDLLSSGVETKNIPEEHLMGPYTIYRKSLPWLEARMYCDFKDGHLASFETHKEALLVIEKLYTISEPPTTEYINGDEKAEFGLDRRYWIGLTDLFSGEGNWTWDVGTRRLPLSYKEMWFTGQPDHVDSNGVAIGPEEHCGALWNPTFHKRRHHSFADQDCKSKYYFICENNTAGVKYSEKDAVKRPDVSAKRKTDRNNKVEKNKSSKPVIKKLNIKTKLGRTMFTNPNEKSQDSEGGFKNPVLHPLFPNLEALKNHPGFSELFQDSESEEIAMEAQRMVTTTANTPVITTTTAIPLMSAATTTSPSKSTSIPSPPTTAKSLTIATSPKTVTKTPKTAAAVVTAGPTVKPTTPGSNDLTGGLDVAGTHLQGTRGVKENDPAIRDTETSLAHPDKNASSIMDINETTVSNLLEELYAAENINNSFPTTTFSGTNKSYFLEGTNIGVGNKVMTNSSSDQAVNSNPTETKNEIDVTETPKGSTAKSVVVSKSGRYAKEGNKSNSSRHRQDDDSSENISNNYPTELPVPVQTDKTDTYESASPKEITNNDQVDNVLKPVIEHKMESPTLKSVIGRANTTTGQNLTEMINGVLRNIVLNVNAAITNLTLQITAAIKNVTATQLLHSSKNVVGLFNTVTESVATTVPTIIRENVELKNDNTKDQEIPSTKLKNVAVRDTSSHPNTNQLKSVKQRKFPLPTYSPVQKNTVTAVTTTGTESFDDKPQIFTTATSQPEPEYINLGDSDSQSDEVNYRPLDQDTYSFAASNQRR